MCNINVLKQSSKLELLSCYEEVADDVVKFIDVAWSWNCAAFFAISSGVLGFIGGIAGV